MYFTKFNNKNPALVRAGFKIGLWNGFCAYINNLILPSIHTSLCSFLLQELLEELGQQVAGQAGNPTLAPLLDRGNRTKHDTNTR